MGIRLIKAASPCPSLLSVPSESPSFMAGDKGCGAEGSRALWGGPGPGPGPGPFPAPPWGRLNLAPGQAALSSANCCPRRLGGCNNHLKGEIKAPLNELLCPRPHLMLWAFTNHAGEGALNVCRGGRGGCSEGRLGRGHGEGALLGGVAGSEQPRRSPGGAR